jgi:hypothetical protein
MDTDNYSGYREAERLNEHGLGRKSAPSSPGTHHPAPLYQHLLANAGEDNMSGGESQDRVDQWGLPHSSRPLARCPNWASSIFRGLLETSSCVATAEPPVFYLKFAIPTASWEMDVVFESAGYACFACCDRSLFEHLPFPPLYHPPTTATGRKKVTGDDLSARTKENGYRRGAH